MPEAKILIVDDTKANLVALQVLLKPVEANIITAESGEQALRAAEQNEDHIALILLDVQMPVMDGFEVARLLNENERTRSIPIIFITATQDDGQIEKAYLSGAVDYIEEPTAPHEDGEVLICCATPRSATGEGSCGDEPGVVLEL